MLNHLKRILAAALVIVTQAACATSTSPYFKPREGIVYEYGNFCGPFLPHFQTPVGSDTEARIRTIQSVQPLDDIDRGCKAHDLCYEFFGHDTGACDRLLFEMFFTNGAFFSHVSAVPRETKQCIDLASEVGTGVSALKLKKNDPFEAADAALIATLSVPLYGLRAVSGLGSAGWPVAGQCKTDEARLTRGKQAAYDVVFGIIMDRICPGAKNNGKILYNPGVDACVAQNTNAVLQAFVAADFMGETRLTKARIDLVISRGR